MGWFGLVRKVTYNAWLQDTYVVQIIQQATDREFFSSFKLVDALKGIFRR